MNTTSKRTSTSCSATRKEDFLKYRTSSTFAHASGGQLGKITI